MVSHSTFTSDLWTEVKDKLVAATIQTTSSSGVTNTVSVKPAYSGDEPDTPIIVVHPVVVDESGYSYGGSTGQKTGNVVVDCVASNTMFLDQVGDQVSSALNANDLAGVDLVNYASDFALNAPGQQKYFLKSFTFTYQLE